MRKLVNGTRRMEGKTNNADWSVNQHRHNRTHWKEFLWVFPKRSTEKTPILEQQV